MRDLTRNARLGVFLWAARATSLLLACAFLFIGAPVYGADDDDDDDAIPTIAKKTKGFEEIDGIFKLYRDPKDGTLFLELSADQLDQEFLYHAQAANGLTDLGWYLTLGSYMDSGSIIRFQRAYDRIEVSRKNTEFYFDPDSPMARASNANVTESTFAALKIAGMSKDEDRFLVNAEWLFLTDAIIPVKLEGAFEDVVDGSLKLGSLSSARTRITDLRNYPDNLEVVSKYVYTESAPDSFGSDAVTDPRNVSVVVQHSISRMPEPGFQTRRADHRLGYFSVNQRDLTSKSSFPYRDIITRWRLEKKDPAATLSPPVKPITFWIENTTPLEYREAVAQGVLSWNAAMETAGFKDAIEVKIQPDDATWDAGDMRYNVVRWVSSPAPRYMGYGPSVNNPETGEVLAADIVLDFTALTGSGFLSDAYGLEDIQKLMPSSFQTGERRSKTGSFLKSLQAHCLAGSAASFKTIFGQTILKSLGASDALTEELIQQVIIETVLHEVGHTLGLRHNFRGSNYLSRTQARDAEVVAEKGLVASVMDYAPINIGKGVTLDEAQTARPAFASTAPGPYDVWAIEYGYTPINPDPAAEVQWMKQHLAKSTEPQNAFAGTAEVINEMEEGVDPRAMMFDLTSDPVGYAEDRLLLVEKRLPELKAAFERDGETWHALRRAYLSLAMSKFLMAQVAARQIGGVWVEHSVIGQEGARVPFEPVPYEDQKRAMSLLSKYVFAPDAFVDSENLLPYLQLQRRGGGRYGFTEDPKFHNLALSAQRGALNHLLHPVVLRRVTDTGLYGNAYSVTEVLDDLTTAIFEADQKTSVTTVRQNLQIAYTEELTGIFNDGERDHVAQSAALQQLRRIEGLARWGRKPDDATKAHRKHLLFLVQAHLYGAPRRF